jgi:hypothetical protein
MKSRERASVPLPALIGIDEFQPAIRWLVALQQCPPPLRQPATECENLTLPVNQHWDNGNIADPVIFNRLPKSLAA